MTTTTNVLGLKSDRSEHDYTVRLGDRDSISGKIACVHDETYQHGVSYDAAWAKILTAGGDDDGIVYVVAVTTGGKKSVYVGKTLGTFSNRYKSGATGGLQKVVKLYDPTQIMECTLYNVSHPGIAEGWCYGILVKRKEANLTNVMDPS
jgi:hypothetical protein